jgi:hypothetical protein
LTDATRHCTSRLITCRVRPRSDQALRRGVTSPESSRRHSRAGRRGPPCRIAAKVVGEIFSRNRPSAPIKGQAPPPHRPTPRQASSLYPHRTTICAAATNLYRRPPLAAGPPPQAVPDQGEHRSRWPSPLFLFPCPQPPSAPGPPAITDAGRASRTVHPLPLLSSKGWGWLLANTPMPLFSFYHNTPPPISLLPFSKLNPKTFRVFTKLNLPFNN